MSIWWLALYSLGRRSVPSCRLWPQLLCRAPLALLAVCSAVALGSCTWEPHARSVQPQQLVVGAARVVRLLDNEGRYALFTLGIGDALHYRILNSATHQSCELPSTDTPVSSLPLLAPSLEGDDVPKFWLPILRVDPTQGPLDAQAPPPKLLLYSDEKCTLIGPFGLSVREPDVLQLRDDKRSVSIVAGPQNTLTLVDPWTPQMRTLSEHSSGHAQVTQADGSSDPEAIWIIEHGKLTQRGLDGTLLLSLGSNVGEFAQVLLQGALRVAFTDGGSMFEAKAPGFVPVLVADDACNPSYNGTSLDLHTPCAAQQLVRINLVTAEITRFTTGVYRAYTQGVANFELVLAADGSTEVWIATPTTRTRMVPTPYDAISVLDATHIAGRTGDGSFGIWDLAARFTEAYPGVDSIQAFRSSRTSRLLWLMQYQIKDGRGTLAGFDQTELEGVVAGTLLTPPTVLGAQVLQGGYSVFLPTILPEPMVLTLEPPITQQADMSFSGQLNARLLSGSLASRIDDGVSSSLLALAPYPGILYGILEGPRSGLWFAAL